MQNYYRKYFILKSYVDRGKSAVIKADIINDRVKIVLSFQGKEIRDNLYLVGFSDSKSLAFKTKLEDKFSIEISKFRKACYFAIVLEKHNACSLEYLEKENEKAILSSFEIYRFDRYSNTKNRRRASQMETFKVFEDSSAKVIEDDQPEDIKKKPEAKKVRNSDSPKSSQKSEGKKQDMGNSMSDMMSSFTKASQLFSTMNNMNSNSDGSSQESADDNKQANENEKKASSPKQEMINPFVEYFPNSEWTKTQYQGQRGYWHYLSGKIYNGQKLVYKAIAVPGEYSIAPPAWLEGFNKYYVSGISTASGYWIMFIDPETGKSVDAPD